MPRYRRRGTINSIAKLSVLFLLRRQLRSAGFAAQDFGLGRFIGQGTLQGRSGSQTDGWWCGPDGRSTGNQEQGQKSDFAKRFVA